MDMARVEIPADLAQAAGLNSGDPSVEAARLLAVEIFREDKVSLGRAAELCQMPIEQFVEFAARHNAPLHYGGGELGECLRMFKRLCACRIRFLTAHLPSPG